MATQPTNNPVPSESPRDLKFNAGKIDEFVTSLAQQYQDRFGNKHWTIEGMRWLAQQAIAMSGFIPVDSFQAGATITLPNQMLRDTSTGEYFRWDGALPKTVPVNSTPSSSGGVGLGKWISVGSGAVGSFADGAGDALIAVKQPFTGSASRTQHEFNRQIPSVLDGKDAVGDGVTDCTSAINAVVAGSGANSDILIPSFGAIEADKYKVTNISNKFGKRFVGGGAIVQADPNGGDKQINFHYDTFADVLGYEYFYPAYQRLVPGQGDANGTLRINLYGDSTIYGLNGETAPFKVETFISNQLSRLGLPNVLVRNKGVSGSSVGDMSAVSDINLGTTDMIVIKYGINDGGNGRSDRKDYFATNLRSKLAEIRALANGTPQKLTIVLVGPNSTNDSPNKRNAYWYEQLRPIYLQAARDYQCAFFDTYSLMPDSYGLAGYALDAPSILAPGVGIHPLDSMQAWIWGKFIDNYFNRSSIAQYAVNHLRNGGAISGSPSASTQAINYDYGVNIYRAKITDGWPIDGVAVTIRSVDQPTVQHLYGFAAGFSKCISRTYNTASNGWNQWTGVAIALTAANGWTATSPEVRVSVDGLVTISAYLTGGTTTSGTSVLSGLPSFLRPPTEKRFAQANDNGTMTCIGVNATSGNIFIVGSAASAAGLHVNLSYYIN